MVILKMKLKGNKIHVKVSGGEVFTIPKNGLYELELYEGMELEYDEIPHIIFKAYEAATRKSAVSILKRRFLSEGMLKDKLLKKGHKKRFIKYAIDYCKEYELIDDKRFVKISINSLKLQGKSKKHIIFHLKKCKIKPRLIEKAENSISDKIDDRALKDAIRKYYKIYEYKYNREDYIIKTLMRKGFKYDRIKTLLSKYIEKNKKDK